MGQAGFATRAIVVSVVVVSTAVLVSTLVVFKATPPAPAVTCLEPKNASSDEVTLFPQGDRISIVENGSLNSSLPIFFCLDQSVDVSGAWNSSERVASFIVPTWELSTFPGCNPGACGHLNGTFEWFLMPGSYALFFWGDSGTNGIVNVTQSIELLFDRVTEMLQPAGPVNLPPGHFADWQLTVPAGSTNVSFDASEAQVNFGFYAGLMNATQFAAFEGNPSAASFQGLVWSGQANSGDFGDILDESGFAPGTYTLVVWNDGSGYGTLQLDGPLYLAYNPL